MSIEDNVRAALKAHRGLTDEDAKEADFLKDLAFDSLDEVELVMLLEDDFDMDIPDAAAEKFKRVDDIVKYITEEQAV